MKLAPISFGALFVVIFSAFLTLELRALVLPGLDISKEATVPRKLASLGEWIDKLEQAGKFNGHPLGQPVRGREREFS
ncbi:hypothetical protein [uncultured Hoeflea sp.]|uniref:hypothetical protein n=1 Tax=uncultured Hoeflea sp. TaxID=538666 RepID=UPI0030D795C5|tara:strand:- start:338 stop:571 length:234 start_codon:yes stop_codon:yes gene_type:complete